MSKKGFPLHENLQTHLQMLSNKLTLFICFIFLLFYFSTTNASDDNVDYNRKFLQKEI